MRIISEIELRAQYKNNPFESFVLKKGDRLTPAASQFLNERRIKILESDEQEEKLSEGKLEKAKRKIDIKDIKIPEEGFVCLPSGKIVKEKPEHCTHVRGKILVVKNDPIIKFRGQLDLLEADFICCINQVSYCGFRDLEEDLTKIFEYLQSIMRAEVLDEPLAFIDFDSWSDEEVRERSHYPDKYFGVKHIKPSPRYGQIYGSINIIRAKVRQLEISAVEAFYDEDKDVCSRRDICMALNRLSSLMYIIICKFIGGHYNF